MIQNMMIIVLLICFIYFGVYAYIIQYNHFFQSSKVVIFLRKFGLRGGTRIHTVMILSHLSPADWTTRRYFERDWYHLTLSAERRTCRCNHFVVSQLITFLLYHTWLCLSRGFFLIFFNLLCSLLLNWKIRQYHSGAQQIITGGLTPTFIL